MSNRDDAKPAAWRQPVGIKSAPLRRNPTGEPAMWAAFNFMGKTTARNVLISQIFVLILLQKFMVLGVSVVLAYFLLSSGWLVIAGHAAISRINAALYAVMLACAAISQLGVDVFSVSSFLLFAALTMTFVIVVPLHSQDYDYLVQRFCSLMVVPGILVLVQYAYQTVYGAGHSLGLEAYVPSSLLLPGYQAESSTSYWVTWNRPNGIVFLEPSYCSAFLALAIIMDCRMFRRYVRSGFFLIALIATNGGTGWLILGLAALSLGLWRHPLPTFATLVAVLVGVNLAHQVVSTLPLLSRLSEFDESGSSGYGRVLLPLMALLKFLGDPDRLFTGAGAGQITEDYGSSWPIVKATFEYGICTAVAYFAFFSVAVARGCSSPARIALFVVIQFTGGYLLNPFMTNLMFVLCTAIRPPHTTRTISRPNHPRTVQLVR